jgi:hypothetical protein
MIGGGGNTGGMNHAIHHNDKAVSARDLRRNAPRPQSPVQNRLRGRKTS